MSLSSIDRVLWGISLAGQLLLLALVIKQRLYRRFPLFCAYIAYASVSDLGFFILFAHLSQFNVFRCYLVNHTLESLLQIGILLEVGYNVLNPVKRSLPRASLYVLGGMLAGAAGMALFFSRHSQVADLDRWSQYFVHISFAVAILRLAIFAAIAGFSQMLGIGWKNHVFQIAVGWLGYSVVILLVEFLHRHTGVDNDFLYHLHDQFRIVSWCMILGYWSYTLSRVEVTRKEFSPKMADFLVSISQVSRANRTALARWYRK